MIYVVVDDSDELLAYDSSVGRENITPMLREWAEDNLLGPISYDRHKYLMCGFEQITFQFWYELDAMLFKLTWA